MTRAVVLSGGGSRGAFQAGALKYLLEEGKPWYKVFCGVSVGAINAAYLAQFTSKGDAVFGLETLWNEISDKDIKKNWQPFRWLSGIWKESLYNTQPLRKLIDRNIDTTKIIKSKNIVRVGAVNLQTHEYKAFTEYDLLKLKSAPILASSSFPMMFEPVKIYNQLWADGGIRTVTPLKAAICIPEVTEIDVILTSKIPEKLNRKPPKNVAEAAKRTLDSMLDEIAVKDIKLAYLYNDLAKAGLTNKRYLKIRVIQPNGGLPGETLSFNHQDILKMKLIGYNTAKQQLT